MRLRDLIWGWRAPSTPTIQIQHKSKQLTPKYIHTCLQPSTLARSILDSTLPLLHPPLCLPRRKPLQLPRRPPPRSRMVDMVRQQFDHRQQQRNNTANRTQQQRNTYGMIEEHIDKHILLSVSCSHLVSTLIVACVNDGPTSTLPPTNQPTPTINTTTYKHNNTTTITHTQ